MSAAIAGDAVAAVLRERLAQAEQYGHDAEADALLPLDALPAKARDFLTIGIDRLRGTLCPRDIPAARRKLIQTAALLLAAIDRLPTDA